MSAPLEFDPEAVERYVSIYGKDVTNDECAFVVADDGGWVRASDYDKLLEMYRASALLTQLPAEGGLYLEHNPHKGDFSTVEKWFENHDHGDPQTQFADISEEEKAECIRLDSLWVLQYYPRTPTSFYCYAASTLEKLLQAASPEPK